ncbi:MAG: alpha/beta fold hydrolase [Actinomycetia bacterium]|nr:alpha/beta fold hydrolase [Actinomycetes bacterium]
MAEPVEWTPLGLGSYEVGVATLIIDDDPERPLTVDVWFPIDASVDVSARPAHQYTFLPGVYYESPTAFTATADEIALDAQHPLIVYSHGSSGLRYLHSSYTEALASHGYVVVAPDHTGNTIVDRLANNTFDPAALSLARVNDVGRLIDAFTDPTQPIAGPFAAAVDTERIAVTGHSFGGFTALAMATGFANDLGTVAADPRVDGIMLMAPAISETAFPDETLATVTVPMIVLVGTDDVTTPVDPNVTRLWALTSNSPAYQVRLVHAEHQTFTDVCQYQDFLPSLTDVPQIIAETIDSYALEGCASGDMDDVRAADITNTYVIQFLNELWYDGPSIDPAILGVPDDVFFEAR